MGTQPFEISICFSYTELSVNYNIRFSFPKDKLQSRPSNQSFLAVPQCPSIPLAKSLPWLRGSSSGARAERLVLPPPTSLPGLISSPCAGKWVSALELNWAMAMALLFAWGGDGEGNLYLTTQAVSKPLRSRLGQ